MWKRYDRWAAAGVWERVGRALGDAELADSIEELQLDSTSVKAHPTAATGRREAGEEKKTPTRADASADPAVG